MSQYPPPPLPDQQHYPPLYPAVSAAQLAETSQQVQEQLQHYNQSVNAQPIYPKVEPSLLDPNHANNVNNGEPRAASQAGADGQAKGNRLRKACDSCSIRKVKRPSRRRGPPNRHAEAIKKRRLESPTASGLSTPSSPTNAAHALASLSSHPTLSAESICSLDVIDLLVNDYFTYIHPLCPFPHEPSFREAYRKREDYTNRPFLALLSSMIGILVASFPRKPRQHLKARGKENLFPNHMSLVNRCQQVCVAARGTGYLEKDDLNVYDAATSYFLGLIGAYTFRWRQCRLYFGECLTIIRSLGLHHHNNHEPYGVAPVLPGLAGSRPGSVDFITQEMCRRLFWTVFVGMKSMQQLGATYGELVILPSTPSEPHPPLPLEVDDIYIYQNHIEQQPPGVVSLMTGFNLNVQIYLSYEPLVTMEIAYGIDHCFDWERQKHVIVGSLKACKHALDRVPPELGMWPAADQYGGQQGQSYYPNMPYHDPALIGSFDTDPDASLEERRRVQFEIQKANIYVSHLATRSYIVEKYWNLAEVHIRMKGTGSASTSPGIAAAGLDAMMGQPSTPSYDITEQEMGAERESIVKDLLVVLGSISQINMEPNADSLTQKIRSIASTLLDDGPKMRKGVVAHQAQQYLARFLEILVSLERVSPANGAEEHRPEDEESELRHWADLREYQTKFNEAGGVFGFA
ncbi:hypothetical protein H2199_001001 [Coniosporium tulheliwenetii]|uniref:Uncharacterized protein n=1 Tax=Coniosporium tulheliwenetii TaxID=3383036 RepID=A0ACC2ZNB0_9PEZI|nr:hypothetical protein H2199_001001 [Cladosporium sp. JES 115]